MEKSVYLDNNATTPLLAEVKEAIAEALDIYGNASSMHQHGQESNALLKRSRKTIANCLKCDPEELIFTGSGSEANNMVIQSFYNQFIRTEDSSEIGERKNHIITSCIEHASIYETCQAYMDKGLEVTFLPVNKYGQVDPANVLDAIKPNTGLITIMYANNEIGTIQPIKDIASIAKEYKILFHSDAVQALGKCKIDFSNENVDIMSFSGHKIGAPKGIGLLYVKNRRHLSPLIHGGHQENGLRAGTENILGIAAFAKALEVATQEMDVNNAKYLLLKKMLREGFEERVPEVVLNGHPEKCLPNTLNITFKYIEGESILLYADFEGISISTGSACSTGSLEPSHVILALGVPHEHAHGSIRFSFGRETSVEDIKHVLEKFPEIVSKLRQMSPLYNTKN